MTTAVKKPTAPVYDPHDPRSGGMVTNVYTAPGAPANVNGSQAGTYVSYNGGVTQANGQPAPTVVSGGTSAPTGPSQAQTDALTYVRGKLAEYGLPATLADWAWSEIIKGANQDQVILDLQDRPEFKQAFPEIQAQRDKGLTPMAPGDIINYRTKAMQAMRDAGIPQGFWDQPSDFSTLISNEVSTDELQHRIDLAKQATYQMPQQVRDHLARDYGIDDGHLIAQFLDPGQAEPLLQKRFLASQIGAAADMTGFGATTVGQNERLADLGVTQQQATAGFNQLANSRELMQSLPGENTTGISQDEQLGAVFGQNADAQRRITQRADQRKAQFAGGGGFASGQGGFSGVGNAQGA